MLMALAARATAQDGSPCRSGVLEGHPIAKTCKRPQNESQGLSRMAARMNESSDQALR